MFDVPAIVNYLSQACVIDGPVTLIFIYLVVPVRTRGVYSHVQICPHNAEFLRCRPQLRPYSTISELLPICYVPYRNFRFYTEIIAVKVRCSCEVYCCAHLIGISVAVPRKVASSMHHPDTPVLLALSP